MGFLGGKGTLNPFLCVPSSSLGPAQCFNFDKQKKLVTGLITALGLGKKKKSKSLNKLFSSHETRKPLNITAVNINLEP